MGETENTTREEIFSKAVRAGKRTYFFDVKSTKSGELYLTITESKRRFDQDQGKFFYEKHKLFLYKEDFEKFSEGYSSVIRYIETGELPANDPDIDQNEDGSDQEAEGFSSVTFEDLDTEKGA